MQQPFRSKSTFKMFSLYEMMKIHQFYLEQKLDWLNALTCVLL